MKGCWIAMRESFLSLALVLLLGSSLMADENLALTAPAYAGKTHHTTHPIMAVDGSVATAWNAGKAATSSDPMKLTIDLWGVAKINRIEAVVAQSAPGETQHVVSLMNGSAEKIASIDWNGQTEDGKTLSYDVGGLDGVRWVVIKTNKSQGWTAWKEVRVFGSRTSVNSEFKNFGYFFGFWDGLNYLNEQKTRANVFMCAGRTQGLANMVKSAKDAGMKSFVPLKQLFGVSEDGTIDATHWEATKALLRPYKDSIVAFVQRDEPYHRHSLNKEQLEEIATIVNASFPEIPISVYFAYSSVVQPDFALPRHHDWFSFDRYLESDENESFQRLLNTYYAQLKRRMSPEQKFFIIGDGYMQGTDKTKQYNRISRAREFYCWGASTKGVVMYLPFQWPNTSAGSGVRSLPFLKTEFDRLSKRIRE